MGKAADVIKSLADVIVPSNEEIGAERAKLDPSQNPAGSKFFCKASPDIAKIFDHFLSTLKFPRGLAAAAQSTLHNKPHDDYSDSVVFIMQDRYKTKFTYYRRDGEPRFGLERSNIYTEDDLLGIFKYIKLEK